MHSLSYNSQQLLRQRSHRKVIIVVSTVIVIVLGAGLSAYAFRLQVGMGNDSGEIAKAPTNGSQQPQPTSPAGDPGQQTDEDSESASSPIPTDSTGGTPPPNTSSPPPSPTPSPSPTPTTPGKPTDSSTGPRIATANVSGGTLSGTHSGKRFTGDVLARGPLTLRDCVIEGKLHVYDGPVLVENCDINGKLNVTPTNTDPNKNILTMRHTKIVGPVDDDVVRIGTYNSWGDNSKYMNTVIEDTIIHSPFNTFGTGKHFDVIQFGGGRNSVFTRVVFSYIYNPFSSEATNYINNGTRNIGVVMNDIWIEGGAVGYVLAGPMTINRCTIERSTKRYGYIYPNSAAYLNNCKDDLGNVITGA